MKNNDLENDIVCLRIPNIVGDPILLVELKLNSETIKITFPKVIIYNIIDAVGVIIKEGLVDITANRKTTIYLKSEYKQIYNIYYYPFISSVYKINTFHIVSDRKCYLEIYLPASYKSLSYLSFVESDNYENIKERETWDERETIYYFELAKSNRLQFTVRNNGKAIFYGLLPLLLPLIICAFGLILNYGALPQIVTDNSTSFLLGIFLALTPFYLTLFNNYMAKAFMSINLGLGLYIVSFFSSIIFIITSIFYPSFQLIFTILLLLVLFLHMSSIKKYFAKGQLNKIAIICLYEPILKILHNKYREAWNKQYRDR